ncbi:MAG: DUF5753 domain-containing protein [Actinophytocola sp.]|uniref:DUF5753 domain-containing protein n=1 Tax=Actinophytocola sp. TaxID=1872138 RepID=UPI003C757246
MNDRDTTVRSRTLTARLHLALKAKGWTVAMLGQAMGWTQSRTSRFLSCKRGTNVLDVATALGHLGVRGTDRDEILDLAASPYECSWWREHGDRLPAQLPVVSSQEGSTTAIDSFHPTLVPALLQVPNYTRALLRAGSAVHPGEIDKHVALLNHRQTVIDRKEPPRLQFIVEEHALTHSRAERRTAVDQVHHLLRLSDRPHVTIRVLPDGAGLIRGYPAFALLSFSDGKPAVYLEMLNVAGFLEQPTTVEVFHRAFADLENTALDEHGSRTWLSEFTASSTP